VAIVLQPRDGMLLAVTVSPAAKVRTEQARICNAITAFRATCAFTSSDSAHALVRILNVARRGEPMKHMRPVSKMLLFYFEGG
jgi:hypothetical protein